jgi:hypothetical protein
MHLIVCIEDKDGLSFCGKRLSFDREVTGHILQVCSCSNLWMNRYSASLFPEAPVIVDESFMEKAGEGDYCFLENIPVPTNIPNLESVIVYHWNRRYPSTVKFPVEILEGRKVVQRVEFSGYSHDKITMERYQ